MAKALTIVKTEDQQPKRKREQIVLIETPPTPDWFVRITLETGRRVWFLRFQLTGMRPRLFGPFTTRHAALLFLDSAIDKLCDGLGEMNDVCSDRMLNVKYQKIWPPIVEHPVLSTRHLPAKKGR
jgi:hypothetical protein